LANNERISRGLPALTIDTRLVNAAYAKGQDMLSKDYWAHYGPNGESPWEFILNSGYDYIYAGENLAKDFSSAAPIHSAWMASPSHRSNILNENFENIGIAAVTGEFEGKETTIVVQMFGATQLVQGDEKEDFGPDGVEGEGSQLPTTGDENILEPPVIIEPQDGEILNEAAFSVRGEAKEGSSVEVFDNEESIGKSEVVDTLFNFGKEERYDEGVHSLYAKAEDGGGNVSSPSNIVNVEVDTIAPYIEKESVAIEYAEIGLGFKRFLFSIVIEDNPTSVVGVYKDEQVTFDLLEGRWQGVITERSSDFAELEITAFDSAGNLDKVTFSTEELQKLASEISLMSGMESTIRKWVVEGLASRIFTRSLRGQINFIIALVMIIILSLEWFVLEKTGLTKEKSSSALHLGVFAILLFAGLLGSGGEIL
jgi:hypothetical protein